MSNLVLSFCVLEPRYWRLYLCVFISAIVCNICPVYVHFVVILMANLVKYKTLLRLGRQFERRHHEVLPSSGTDEISIWPPVSGQER